MKRMKIVGLSLLAALAVSAVAVASASALPNPEVGRCVAKAGGVYANSGCDKVEAGKNKFEWEPYPLPKANFTTVIHKIKSTESEPHATLETVKKEQVICTGETSTGKYSGLHSVNGIVVTFTNCEALGFKCKTVGAKEGELITKELEGTFGIWKKGTKEHGIADKAGVDLQPVGGGLFIEFECAGIPIAVRGHVIGQVPSNKMEKEGKANLQKFIASKGKQKPEKFLEGEKQILESSFAGGEFIQAGQEIYSEQKNEEKVELRVFE